MTTKGDYQGIANRVRTEMDPRSPRLRLSLIGYLSEAGVTPESVGGVETWLTLVKDTIDYIGEDMEEFATMIAELVPPEEEEDKAEAVKDAYDISKSYL